MCGIVGLFTKNPEVQGKLGDYISTMLIEMTERGPDSAGVAVYRNAAADQAVKFSLYSPQADYPWKQLAQDLTTDLGCKVDFDVVSSHAIVVVHGAFDNFQEWFRRRHPEVRIMSSGQAIEIFKEKGLPKSVIDRFALRSMTGTHAIGHTRMATESAVTTEHSHPFSTGLDLCLVHNGSLSNHNRLRRELRREGIEFQTDNDSEVAAGYLTHRMGQGASLDEALQSALEDLDGFFTFAVGTRDGFAVVRDPIACKHAVMAETDDWVAMATEFRAIAHLPGADKAAIWEPVPGRIYSWSHN